jgi:hypothetical protein
MDVPAGEVRRALLDGQSRAQPTSPARTALSSTYRAAASK